jgi:dipeptidyl aminopeptidase/acylaminoacyl peptidase
MPQWQQMSSPVAATGLIAHETVATGSSAAENVSSPQVATSDAIIESAVNDLASTSGYLSASAGSEPATFSADSSPAPVRPGKPVFLFCETLEKNDASNYHGFISGDMQQLLFASNRNRLDGNPIYQCFSKKLEEKAAATRMFDWPGNVWTPEFTPDNSKIVFSSDSSTPEHIFVYDSVSGKSGPLTSGNSKNMMPAISPDGKLVAFVSNRKGSNSIWLVGIDGANLLQITSGSSDDREPRWTADGRAIVFTRIHQPLKKSDIMKIQLDPMGDAQAIISNGKRNWLADIAPDGTTLAYIRSDSTDGSKNVLVLHDLADASEQVIKPVGDAEYYRPVWTADSSAIVFHATVQGNRSLYLARFKRENQN